MVKQKKSPIEQKAKLVEQLKEIENKITQFDEQRANKIAGLSKRFGLLDLSDDILEKEFKNLRDKYKKEQEVIQTHLDESKKNS